MKRWISVAVSLAYPVLILLLLHHFAAAVPRFAAIGLKLYPVAISFVLLVTFGRSLFGPVSFVEKLARLRRPNLDAAAIAYTRTVTKVWCAFFIFNGLMALALALWGSTKAWFIYTGIIAYVLMGLLFGGEWLVRRRLIHAEP